MNNFVSKYVREYNPQEDDHRVMSYASKVEDLKFYYAEVISHIIAHKFHNHGQLSVWSRQLEKKPVTANVLSLNKA